MDFCSCGHGVADHLHGTGRCRSDDDGERCPCNAFDADPDDGPDC